MKIKNNLVYTSCCILCANPYDKRDLIYIKDGMFHRSCLKQMIKFKNNNLTDNEIEFVIDTEIKEYRNELQRKRLANIINKNL